MDGTFYIRFGLWAWALWIQRKQKVNLECTITIKSCSCLGIQVALHLGIIYLYYKSKHILISIKCSHDLGQEFLQPLIGVGLLQWLLIEEWSWYWKTDLLLVGIWPHSLSSDLICHGCRQYQTLIAASGSCFHAISSTDCFQLQLSTSPSPPPSS